jgi:hypothetical protein
LFVHVLLTRLFGLESDAGIVRGMFRLLPPIAQIPLRRSDSVDNPVVVIPAGHG